MKKLWNIKMIVISNIILTLRIVFKNLEKALDDPDKRKNRIYPVHRTTKIGYVKTAKARIEKTQQKKQI